MTSFMCLLKSNGIFILIGCILILIVLVIVINSIDVCKSKRNEPYIYSLKFYCDKQLKKKDYLYIDESINVIPASCFKDCEELKRIDFKGDISYLGKDAFHGCENLEEINFLGKLEYYDSNVFKNLKSLKRLYINEIRIIKTDSFENLPNLEYVTIKKKLELIEDGAFKNCLTLKGLRLPAPIPIITDEHIINHSEVIDVIFTDYNKIDFGQMVFWNNTFIQMLNIPNNCNRLPSGMFAYCSNLETITIPETVVKIERHCFSACMKLKEIEYKGSLDNFKNVYSRFKLELPSECLIKTSNFPNGKKVKDLL